MVIPLYNHEKYIEDALKSVFEQKAKPSEIIVIDDGSTDGSAATMKKLCATHPEIAFWSQPNRGAHRTINAGISHATGEFVAVLNSDDTYHPERLMQCLKIFERDPTVAAVTTGVAFIDDHGDGIRNAWYEQARCFYDEIQDLALALINANFFMTTSNLMVRRSVFGEVGLFSALRYTHDLDFFLRLLVHQKPVYFLDMPLVNYRIHPSNTIRQSQFKLKLEWACIAAFFLFNMLKQENRHRMNWAYLKKYLGIMVRHTLISLMIYFLACFARSKTTPLRSNTFFNPNHAGIDTRAGCQGLTDHLGRFEEYFAPRNGTRPEHSVGRESVDNG